MNKIESTISNIDDKYIYEAYTYINKRKSKWYQMKRKLNTMAACFVAFIVLSTSTLSIATSAGSIPAYELLYSLYPKLATKLVPVNVSSEDNGIKMEVESVYVHNDTAEIYISMKDITDNRIDETIDLFDSYEIYPLSDSIGTCSFIDYNKEEKEATFLIRIQNMKQNKIEGKKLTFSVSQFLSGKQNLKRELTEVSLENIETVTDIKKDVRMRGWAGMLLENSEADDEAEIKNKSGYLKENESQRVSPIDGVAVTAVGFIDNKLHIQAYYEDILKTDNHGVVYLKDENGNTIKCLLSVSFWDEEQKGSYEEYIFDISPENDLSEFSVWGEFKTCRNLETGNWKVTFPIENRE